MQVTDEMVERASEAFAKSYSVYPDGEAKTPITDWFDLDAQDAVDFGVLKEPKWDGISDIRGMQHEWYVASVIKEPMRAALTAALSDQERAVEVKALEWTPIVEGGRDMQAKTEFGLYTISIDSSFAGGTHYLWTPDQREFDDDHHSEYRSRTLALKAAQADYEQRIRASHVDVPAVEPAGEAGEMPGSNGGFTMAVFKASDVPLGTKLYAHPPLREGEDSAEVIYQAVREFRLSNMCFEEGDAYCLVDLMTADGRDISDGEEQMRELALAIADALAATRSGSATGTKGCAE